MQELMPASSEQINHGNSEPESKIKTTPKATISAGNMSFAIHKCCQAVQDLVAKIKEMNVTQEHHRVDGELELLLVLHVFVHLREEDPVASGK